MSDPAEEDAVPQFAWRVAILTAADEHLGNSLLSAA
jgi:hypothetical protein